MEREILMQNRANNGIKRLLKRFRNYKLVDNIDNAHILIVFYKEDVENFNVILIDEEVKEELKTTTYDAYFFYLRHKNNRNAKQLVLADIDKIRFIRN